MSVENLVERMAFLEAFIDDMEEFSAKVGFTLELKVGLYYVMSLFLFLLFLGVGSELYVSLWSYPLSSG